MSPKQALKLLPTLQNEDFLCWIGKQSQVWQLYIELNESKQDSAVFLSMTGWASDWGPATSGNLSTMWSSENNRFTEHIIFKRWEHLSLFNL